MAHLWINEREIVSPGEWAVMPLTEAAVALGGGSVLLLRSRSAFGDQWLAMTATPRGVRLNGSPLLTGIRVLDDRDELHIEGMGHVFFSTEALAVVESFSGSDRPVRCPRCKESIAASSPVVRCPQCGVWHHQSEEFPCWTYSACCALCPQPTALEAAYRWTPEEL